MFSFLKPFRIQVGIIKDNPPESYKDSKQYLIRQQKIDYLLVLTKILEPGMVVQTNLIREASKQITEILTEINE